MSAKAAPRYSYRQVITAWALYDWANSAFATTIMAAVLPPFFATVAAATLAPNVATAYWAYISSAALLLVALAAPILGAVADHTGGKKRYLAFFAAVGILFTMLLFFVGEGDWPLAAFFYVLAEIGFSGSIIFYDSLLPHVARADDIDQISSRGYALGYLGGGILLAVNLVMIQFPQLLGIPSTEMGVRLSFVTVGLWWALFSVPLFRRVGEPPTVHAPSEAATPLRAGFQHLGQTFRQMRRYRELWKFLIAFWIYNDGIGTIIKLATIYGTEIGIGQADLIGALLLTQFIGVPFALLFGRLARRLGAKTSIQIGLAVYALISLLGYFMTEAWQFWVLAAMVGLVQGGSQALSRSLYGAMTPKAKTRPVLWFL